MKPSFTSMIQHLKTSTDKLDKCLKTPSENVCNWAHMHEELTNFKMRCKATAGDPQVVCVLFSMQEFHVCIPELQVSLCAAGQEHLAAGGEAAGHHTGFTDCTASANTVTKRTAPFLCTHLKFVMQDAGWNVGPCGMTICWGKFYKNQTCETYYTIFSVQSSRLMCLVCHLQVKNVRMKVK